MIFLALIAAGLSATSGSTPNDALAHQSGAKPLNRAPTAVMRVLRSVNSTFLFSSSSTDPDGSIKQTSWDFGDGAKATGIDVRHTYRGAGLYLVTLTVTDNGGLRAAAFKTVRVSDAEPPVARAFRSSGSRGKGVHLQYTASDDSGEVRIDLRIERGPRLLKVNRTGFALADGERRDAIWRAPGRTIKGLRFCVVATDHAGNTSEPSCAPIILR